MSMMLERYKRRQTLADIKAVNVKYSHQLQPLQPAKHKDRSQTIDQTVGGFEDQKNVKDEQSEVGDFNQNETNEKLEKSLHQKLHLKKSKLFKTFQETQPPSNPVENPALSSQTIVEGLVSALKTHSREQRQERTKIKIYSDPETNPSPGMILELDASQITKELRLRKVCRKSSSNQVGGVNSDKKPLFNNRLNESLMHPSHCRTHSQREEKTHRVFRTLGVKNSLTLTQSIDQSRKKKRYGLMTSKWLKSMDSDRNSRINNTPYMCRE